MSFRLDALLEDFDGSKPDGNIPNAHSLVITAPTGERILWARVRSTSQVSGTGLSTVWYAPASIHIDGNSEIDEVEFTLPNGSGEHAINVMYYTI